MQMPLPQQPLKQTLKHWRRLEVEINRLRAWGAALTQQEKRGLHTQRKARTRTLIQVGGLLKVAGLFDIFGIEEGMELQLSPEGQSRAGQLLGYLLEHSESRAALPTEEERARWQTIGQRMLKMRQAKYY